MRFVLAILCVAVGVAHALSVPPSWARGGVFAVYNNVEQSNSLAVERLLSVPLDHFNTSRTDKMSIRYWVEESCYREGGPIFFNMGGEAEGGAARCDARAQAMGALVVSYEHRFYGASVPVEGDLSDENMPFLSVEQNLADANQLVATVKSSSPLYQNASVIAFGGSYSGATCAWFRIAYPHTVQGCVSSSGVVNAIYKFVGFDETIQEATTHPDSACNTRLGEAMKALDRAFDAGKGSEVKKRMNATNLVNTPMGDSDFFYAAADATAMLVQYGQKQLLCSVLAELPSNPTDAQRLDNLADVIVRGYGIEFMSNCFYDSNCLREPQAPFVGVGNRQWRWQKCSQLAYFQIAPPNATLPMRSRHLTIEVLEQQCEYVFGAGMLPDTEAFDRKYGGDKPKGTNIFFMDFSDDPWKRASVDHTEGSTLHFCMTTCDGCGHCGAGVPATLMQKCEDEATQQIKSWLA